MSDGIDLLDVSSLQTELDAFLRISQGAGESILSYARVLIQRLEQAPDSDVENWDDLPTLRGEQPTPFAGVSNHWFATRVTLSTGERTLTCWNEAGRITIIAAFRGAIEESLIVQSGDRYWASRATEHGESRISDDETVQGPADRRPFADLERRSREEMERWTKEHPKTERWVCTNCSWQNERDEAMCRVCGMAMPVAGSGTPISQENRPTVFDANPAPDEAPRSNVMTLPPGLDQILRGLIAVAAKVPEGPRFQVVLRAFAPESRDAILDAVRETAPSDAEKLIANLPAVIANGLSVEKARELGERLKKLGATVEMQKDRS